MPTPLECFVESVSRWEGGFQDMTEDFGNWVNCQGERRLVGTMRGVTPLALAQHTGVDPCSLTAQAMQETVTLELAAEIGMKGYYRDPGFDSLDWSPLVWIATDIGWGSGPLRGVKMLQALIGAGADGFIGPQTQAAYAAYLHRVPIEEACTRLADARRAFYERISAPGTKNHKFRAGWVRRANYYSPGGSGDADPWWPKWAGWQPSGASDSSKPVDLDPVEPVPDPQYNRRALVMAIQTALTVHAPANLAVDGAMGPKTRAALREFAGV